MAVFSSEGAVAEGETVVFDGSGSYSQDSGNIADYEWNFGDNTIVSGTDAEVSHVYAVAGNYTVSLTVTDNAGQTGPASSLTLNIGGNQPPAALFGYSGQMTADALITFDASASSDPDGRDLTYAWDFDGDGETDGTGSVVSRAFIPGIRTLPCSSPPWCKAHLLRSSSENTGAGIEAQYKSL